MITYLERLKIVNDPVELEKYRQLYSLPTVDACLDFINRFCVTYDPRLEKSKTVPFALFPKQVEFVKWLWKTLRNKENGIVDKCRDVGASWCFVAFSAYMILFHRDVSIGFFTFRERDCDKRGDISTLFGKVRFLIDHLPIAFRGDIQASHMYIRNNATNSDIAGASGDNPGRSGRRTIFFKDEAQPLTAHIQTPTGHIAMGEIQIGDVILSPNGGTQTVTHIIDHGICPVYRVTFSDGTSAECSENHLWTVTSRLGKKRTQTKRLAEILHDYIYEKPDGGNMFRYSIPLAYCQTIARIIRKIERIDDQPVRCISVSNQDGLYLTNNNIVTHNCAFYQRPEMIEASLSETSDCIIDVSTHKGTDTLFFRKSRAEGANVFAFDWWDVPSHTQEWYNKKKEKASNEGMLHIFAREIDRDPHSSNDRVLIPRAWTNALMTCDIACHGKIIAALDIADEGQDTNALIVVSGNELIYIDEWSEGDTGQTTTRAVWKAIELGATEFRYDSIGVGAGAKATINRLKETNPDDSRIQDMIFRAYNAGAGVVRAEEEDYNDTPNNRMFLNRKAQAYWRVREQIYNTYQYTQKKDYIREKCLKFAENLDTIKTEKILNELSQVRHKTNENGKLIIDKKPKGTKSPNLADAFVMARAEFEEYAMGWVQF